MTNKVLIVFCLGLFLTSIVSAMANPAAVYCEEMGYDYEVKETPFGDFGKCDVGRRSYDAWDFFNGKVGKKYSYCSVNGYNIETVSGGKYSPEEAVCVFKIGLNGKSKTEKVSMSEMMGLDEELEKSSHVKNIPKRKRKSKISTNAIASSVDWRNVNGKNYITSVKDQGGRGTCTEFASVAVVEAQRNIDLNLQDINFDLSEQDLTSCSGPGGNLYNIKNNGLVDEACFPYEPLAGVPCSKKCSNPQMIERISEYNYVYGEGKKFLSEHGAVKATLWMGGSFDKNAVYRGSNNNANHEILIVGYNDNEFGGYWIAKNSWGSDWNEQGYFKIGYNEVNIIPTAYVTYSGGGSGDKPVLSSPINGNKMTTAKFSWIDDDMADAYKIVVKKGRRKVFAKKIKGATSYIASGKKLTKLKNKEGKTLKWFVKAYYYDSNGKVSEKLKSGSETFVVDLV